MTEFPTPGKSGSFFYFSYDQKYVIKTINTNEFKVLKQILPSYYLVNLYFYIINKNFFIIAYNTKSK